MEFEFTFLLSIAFHGIISQASIAIEPPISDHICPIHLEITFLPSSFTKLGTLKKVGTPINAIART
jgi:hypothetical protein